MLFYYWLSLISTITCFDDDIDSYNLDLLDRETTKTTKMDYSEFNIIANSPSTAAPSWGPTPPPNINRYR